MGLPRSNDDEARFSAYVAKPEIALTQIRWACEAGLPRGAVLMDAGYGVDTDLRTSLTALGLSYVAGIQSHTTVWPPGTGPRPPKKWLGLVSRVSPVQTAVRNCTRDEGRSFEVGNQVLISSHRKPLSSKAMVVNVAEKSEQDFDRHD